jgi:hypothetical protein
LIPNLATLKRTLVAFAVSFDVTDFQGDVAPLLEMLLG